KIIKSRKMRNGPAAGPRGVCCKLNCPRDLEPSLLPGGRGSLRIWMRLILHECYRRIGRGLIKARMPREQGCRTYLIFWAFLVLGTQKRPENAAFLRGRMH